MKQRDLGVSTTAQETHPVSGGFLKRAQTQFARLFSRSPARLAVGAFILIIVIFTLLLKIPAATESGRSANLADAGLTAVSAVTVTGLTSVNTADHWSFLGQIIILTAIQIGGLGVMTMVTLLSMAVTDRFGISSRLASMKDTGSGTLGDTGGLLRTVLATTFVIELALALVLVPRFIGYQDGDIAAGLWRGIFYAISAFCNAGFSLHPDGLAAYVHDPLVLGTVNVGVIIGSLGAPTIMVLRRVIFTRAPQHMRKRRMTLHAKLTLTMTVALLLLGFLLIGLLEWMNPHTLGGLDSTGEKIHGAWTTSVMTRSGGYSIFDLQELTPASMILVNGLMFIGGGSGSTAGGIKVTTLAVLLLAIIAEARGRQSVTAFKRRIPGASIRVAIAVLVGSATACVAAMMLLAVISGAEMDLVVFEVLSAFGTCGLSTGLAADTNGWGKLVLCIMMFLGRVGTITLASGLALRQSPALYEYPDERPIIG